MAGVALVEEGNRGAREFASALAAAGHDVIAIGLEPSAEPVAVGARLVAPPLDVEVSPPTLDVSYRLFTFLERHPFDPIVFGDEGGHGYCVARARQLGLGFEDTVVVIQCSGTVHWGAEGDPTTSLPLDDVRQAACEGLAVELADALVLPDVLREWIGEQRWEARGMAFPGSEAGWAGALETTGRRGGAAHEEPAVTVVVTHHERPELLLQCLEGLARQAYANLAVIVVDDGSESVEARGALDLIEARSWPWPLTVVRAVHAELSAARNAGWRHARSELVVFIDDDDVAFDEMVSTLVRDRAFSGADVVAAGILSFASDDGPRPVDGDVVGVFLGQPYEFGLLKNQYGGPVCIWPRALLELLGGFRDEESFQEDGEMLARAALAGAVRRSDASPSLLGPPHPPGHVHGGS